MQRWSVANPQKHSGSMLQAKGIGTITLNMHVGSLMHLGLCTRPDILFAVTKLSQFNVNPGREYWNQVKHIFMYLSKT